MATRKKCAACKRRAVKGPRATYCADVACERARARERVRKSDAKARESAATEPKEAPPAPQLGGVFATTLQTLTDAGRIHTPAAQNALKLAAWMDAAGEDSGGGKAALSKQHLAALEVALADTDKAADPVDEFTSRREKRLASA